MSKNPHLSIESIFASLLPIQVGDMNFAHRWKGVYRVVKSLISLKTKLGTWNNVSRTPTTKFNLKRNVAACFFVRDAL